MKAACFLIGKKEKNFKIDYCLAPACTQYLSMFKLPNVSRKELMGFISGSSGTLLHHWRQHLAVN